MLLDDDSCVGRDEPSWSLFRGRGMSGRQPVYVCPRSPPRPAPGRGAARVQLAWLPATAASPASRSAARGARQLSRAVVDQGQERAAARRLVPAARRAPAFAFPPAPPPGASGRGGCRRGTVRAMEMEPLRGPPSVVLNVTRPEKCKTNCRCRKIKGGLAGGQTLPLLSVVLVVGYGKAGGHQETEIFGKCPTLPGPDLGEYVWKLKNSCRFGKLRS